MVDTKKMVYSLNEIGIEMVFINHLRSTMKTISNFPGLHQFVVALVLLTTFAALPKSAHAQLPCGGGTKAIVTNSGTEFLLVFMQNENTDYDASVGSASYFQNIYIASLDNTAKVTITCRLYPSFNKTITLPPRTSQVISLVTAAFPSFLVLSDEVVDQTVVVVKSDSAIVCYGMNHKTATADAFLALPKNVAATAYMAMCYSNSNSDVFGTFLQPSEFAVAAFDSNTTVTITPSVTTQSGGFPNVPINYILHAGECVQIQANINGAGSIDLTGSIITSNKPIAVFSGHKRSEVPHDYVYYDDQSNPHSSRDHLAEQMPPICAWGKSFIATNFKPRVLGDVMRVLVSENGTTVKINGQAWTTLNRGQYRDTLIAYSDTATNNIFTIETSQPSLVGMYAHSTNSGSGLGDPFFAIVPPLEQTYNDFTYFISNYSVYNGNNFVVIATEASGAGKISLNGVVQPAASYQPAYGTINGKKYAVGTFQQPVTGINRAKSPNSEDKGFTILAYGFGVVDSYGYTAGSLLKPIGCLMNMNNTASSPAPGGSPSLPFYKLRNIMDAPVYVDSVRIRYNSNPEHIYVEAKNMPMTYLPTIGMGEELPLTLIPRSTPTQPISGIATVYSHTGLWIDLVPYELPFTIQAGSTSSVTPIKEHSAQAELYPNPVRGDATLLFTIGAASHVTIEVYDALGRLVTIATDEMMSEGSHNIRLSGSKLPNGTYFYRISVPGLGIADRGEFIVVH